MKISVTNLGPIKEATVELGGLTVFVGPNGTGKSYLAEVILYWFSVTWTWLSYKLKRSRSNYVKEKQVMVVRR